jgi:5-methylcytosine-specific restriction enzyme A
MSWDGERTESSRRTGSRRWRALRLRVLDRDDYLCQLQLLGCTGGADQVDHIIPVHLGGEDDETNAASVCAHCHAAKTGRESATARTRHTGKRPPAKHPADYMTERPGLRW